MKRKRILENQEEEMKEQWIERGNVSISVSPKNCSVVRTCRSKTHTQDWNEKKQKTHEKKETARFYCYIESKRINSISEITKLKGEEVDLTLNHTTLLISCRLLGKCNWLMLTHWTIATKSREC